jgi:serine/threonine protein kinase
MSGNFFLCIVSLNQIDVYPNLDSCLNVELAYSINPLSQSTDYLDVDVYCNVGDKVYSEDGSVIILTEKISTGAEGIVFRTADPKWVAKIYHKGVITPLRWRKLIRMTKTGLSAKGICWPSVLLYSFNNGPVGYLMPTAEGNTLGTIFDGPDAVLEHFPVWQRIDVLQTAAHIIEKVVYLQLHGVLIGDMQLKNMMIKDPENVFLIDMDSVQIEDMPCPVGTEDYTPPELWDFSFSEILRRPFHEDYSCGILVFSLLFCGQHPYAQRLGKETLREEILANSFPYLSNSSAESMIPVGGYDKIWDALTENLKIMFIEAFSRGKRFEPIEWYSAITEYRDLLLRREYTDEQSYLLFPHTNLTATKERPVNSTYKKTIREAIIQAPLNSNRVDTSSSSFANKMLYNRQSGNAAAEERFFEPVKVPEEKLIANNREGIGNPITRDTELRGLKNKTRHYKSESFLSKLIHKLKKDRSLILFILFLVLAAVLVLLAIFLD